MNKYAKELQLNNTHFASPRKYIFYINRWPS